MATGIVRELLKIEGDTSALLAVAADAREAKREIAGLQDGLNQVAGPLDTVADKSGRIVPPGKSLGKFADGLDDVGKSGHKAGRGVAAVAQQLPDVISQMATGTPVLTIFTQQGLQVAQVLGLAETAAVGLSAVAGPLIVLLAGIATAGAVVANKLDEAADASGRFNDRMEESTTRLAAYRASLVDAQGGISKARDVTGELEDELLKASGVLTDTDVAINKATRGIEDGFNPAIVAAGSEVAELQRQLRSVDAEMTKIQSSAYWGGLGELREQRARIEGSLGAATERQGALTGERDASIEGAAKAILETERLREQERRNREARSRLQREQAANLKEQLDMEAQQRAMLAQVSGLSIGNAWAAGSRTGGETGGVDFSGFAGRIGAAGSASELDIIGQELNGLIKMVGEEAAAASKEAEAAAQASARTWDQGARALDQMNASAARQVETILDSLDPGARYEKQIAAISDAMGRGAVDLERGGQAIQALKDQQILGRIDAGRSAMDALGAIGGGDIASGLPQLLQGAGGATGSAGIAAAGVDPVTMAIAAAMQLVVTGVQAGIKAVDFVAGIGALGVEGFQEKSETRVADFEAGLQALPEIIGTLIPDLVEGIGGAITDNPEFWGELVDAINQAAEYITVYLATDFLPNLFLQLRAALAGGITDRLGGAPGGIVPTIQAFDAGSLGLGQGVRDSLERGPRQGGNTINVFGMVTDSVETFRERFDERGGLLGLNRGN